MADRGRSKIKRTVPEKDSFDAAFEEAKKAARRAAQAKQKQPDKATVSPRPLDQPGKASTGNIYAGLTPATKRKHVEPVTLEQTQTVPQTSESSDDSSPQQTPAQEGSKRPFAPPKKPKKTKTTKNEGESVETRTTRRSSEWYDNIDMKEKYTRADVENVKYINTLIRRCQEPPQTNDSERLFSELRQRLHQMEFYDFISGIILHKSKVLDDKQGLPAIFDETFNRGVQYPWDIIADAEALFLRWLSGVLDPHLLRGVDTVRKNTTTGKRTAHKLSPSYKHRKSCDHIGAGDLQNGQWWPLQICAMRDGAHGEIEAGIHGKPGKGALSVVLSSGGYADMDEGNTIRYCGTSGSVGKPTVGTIHLKHASTLGTPVRVLRSSALPARNPYRPSRGLRYDGLYDVVSFEILDEATAMHRFLLERREGQDPIRYTGVQARPTNEEVAEYTKIRGLLGLSS